ncbi:MAG TPA: O-antigen ligase family protein, partial [Solirubrobacteraceae bacterium]|nr:O-antigen ligase family protein [Solirubrobacteraceae bacterium]
MAGIEIALVLGAGLAVAAALLFAHRDEPLYGSVALACLGAVTAVTAISMTWSIAPDDTLEEAARSFAYLAVFAAAVAGAQLAPRAAPVVVPGILLAAVAVVLYALGTRIWPAGDELGARLGEPYDYWNALGATAALALVPALWLGVREAGQTLSRALAFPALGLLIVTMLLTQSRGALAAAVLVVTIWVAVVPLRLRSLAVIAPAVLAAAPVAAWALSKDAFTEARQPLSAREAVAGEFGLLLLLMVVLLLAAGLAVERVAGGRATSLRVRRRLGLAAVAAVCLVPLVGLTSVAMSDRGFSGTFSDRVGEVTDNAVAPPRGAARLGSVSSSRGAYWRQARHVFEERPLLGTGAGTFGIARLPYRKDQSVSQHAHGLIAQTIADMGILGLAAVLALLAAWLVAAARATGLGPRREGAPRPAWSDERMALVALGLCALAFGVHSAADWTWFVPGPSAMALVAAGFVAGRGPLPAVGAPPERPSAPRGGRPEPLRIMAAAGVLVGAG